MIPAPAPPPPAPPHLRFDTWPPHDTAAPDPPPPPQGSWDRLERILPTAPALDNAEPRGRGGRRRNCPSPGRRARSLRRRAEKEEERRREFSVALSKDEIDEDFYAFTGRRAPARPKKIPRSLKRQLDVLFPGMGLTEVALADYKVAPQAGRAARR